ncbi:MAG: RNA methyltransferase, partial [Bdellovibrionales bacterium]|nr:RNA methyltransferase [Bdellovibrionales bacterium]
GRDYNPDRSDAFELVRVVNWLEDAVADITRRTGEKPFVVMTSARRVDGVERLTCRELRGKIGERPVFLVFGTGWGIDESVLKTASAVLEPIEPERESGYNHLSVRSAVAIYLDRLLGSGRG